MQQKPKEILKHASIVFIFWWILFIWPTLSWDYLSVLISDQAFRWGVVALGCAVGIALTMIYLKMVRSDREKMLFSATTRGIQSTIGALPLHKPALPKSEEKLENELVNYFPKEAVNFSEHLNAWRQEQEKTGKDGYLKLFDAVLSCLSHSEVIDLPATHADDPRHNHGGRTLLTHSLLVCYLMLREAKSYEYRPAQSNSGYKHIALKNPGYAFNSKDPLIPILGLAHDLGKIECFIRNEDGHVIDCSPNHDLIGAQMISRLDEYWSESISSEDRQFLSLIMAFYHHPSEMPMANYDSVVIDDRLHALLELLIWCDRVASAMENNQENLQEVREQLQRDMAFDQDDEKRHSLWDAVVEVLTGADRINTMSSSNVGRAYHLPQFGKQVIILREDVFVQAVAHNADMVDRLHERIGEKGGNGVSVLTRDILREFGRRNLLFKDHETDNRSDDSSLFRVEFYSPDDYFSDANLTDPKPSLELPPKSTWASSICITLENDEAAEPALECLLSLDNCPQVPHIAHSRFGRQGVHTKNKAKGKHASGMEGVTTLSAQTETPKQIDSKVLRRSLLIALEGKNPNLHYKTLSDGRIAVINSDSWFKDQDIDPATLTNKSVEFLLAAGIARVGESKEHPGQHYFVLEEGLFTPEA